MFHYAQLAKNIGIPTEQDFPFPACFRAGSKNV